MSQISTKLLKHFSNDFVQHFKTEYNYNFIVKVGSQNFKLHSLILYQHSSFFHRGLSTATKKNNINEITLTHTSVESFKILIKYIYTGTITFEGVELSTIFDLLVPSNKLEESEIWDKVIQWGKEPTPNLLSDFEQWNNEIF
ncbi:hypothetical protein C2G38_2168264 [Gigaspora rosea]|uniref:BTB domain-containing protein n=1 Tax=Gigaspora rosea TaxID=44941 RepID=A0A397VPZ8_9GLOM|nr:hypothetical protein C2G38_2168264 [Gigaspora rosea]